MGVVAVRLAREESPDDNLHLRFAGRKLGKIAVVRDHDDCGVLRLPFALEPESSDRVSGEKLPLSPRRVPVWPCCSPRLSAPLIQVWRADIVRVDRLASPIGKAGGQGLSLLELAVHQGDQLGCGGIRRLAGPHRLE